MKELDGFYTFNTLDLPDNMRLTISMEDYLEMISRLYINEETVRINVLAKRLHVKPSSASKMVANLREEGLVDFQPYGEIRLTDKGKKIGNYLLFRHQVVHQFLCLLNDSSDELAQAEKIEHFLSKTTIYNLNRLISRDIWTKT